MSPARTRSSARRRIGMVLAAAVATSVLSLAPATAQAEEVLLSGGKDVYVSSTQSGLPASNAVDGDLGTRWSSDWSDDEWITVDLGSIQTISRIELVWETAHARDFTLATNNTSPEANPVDSATIARQTNFGGGTYSREVTGSPGLQTQARYVTVRGLDRATDWGYSLFEFRVFGQSGAVDPEEPPVEPEEPPVDPEEPPVDPEEPPVEPEEPPVEPGDPLPTSDTPDLGQNVEVFDPTTPIATIQSRIDAAFNEQLLSPTAQFGEQRPTFLFKPGEYGRVFANLGFYTTVAGLGRNPDDVTISGAVNVDSGWNFGDERNATQNFWRSMENLAIEPEGGTNRWAVSQAAPMRRIHIKGDLTLAPSNQDFGQGYSSGGYLADSRVDGAISSGSQQQWYTRNSTIGRWDGGVWNMTFSGVQGAPAQAFPTPPYTTLATTPVTREKPYLYVDDAGLYRVFTPALQSESAGATWPDTPGTSLPMREFYVAKPGDSAARINQALAQGLHLFFTPGTYELSETIRVDQPNTVVTGIGFPTLVPLGGVEALSVADVPGVRIANLTFDAGTVNSPTLMSVGRPGVHADFSGNPISIQDVFFRIGSSIQGNATTTLAVHADDTIIDHIWAWRADHGGAPTGWDVNRGDTGLIVNGDDVLATGLFVEHYQKYEVIWNGERGRTIFFQNEKPYDVPDQASWQGPTGQGYAAYKVADSVNQHQLWGGGSYSYFNVNPSVQLDRAFEVPVKPGVQLRSLLTVSLGDIGTINNVVNDTGGAVPNPAGNTSPRYVTSYGG